MQNIKDYYMRALFFSLLINGLCLQAQNTYTYPLTKKVAQTDDYFGTKISDPYRWLEYENS